MPGFDKLRVGSRERRNKLVVNIDPVKHTIMSKNGLFLIDYCLNNQAYTHFSSPDLINRKFSFFFLFFLLRLFLLFSTRLSEWWPIQLLSS